MTLPVQPVTCRFFDQDGLPIAARVSFKLTVQDTYNGIVVGPTADYVTCEATTGIGVINLFPNALGSNGSQYTVKAVDSVTGRKILAETLCTVPNSPCYLDLILNQEPFPSMDASEAAMIAVRVAAAQVISDRDAAATSAANAAISAGASADDVLMTHADVISTHTDAASVGAAASAASADATATAADRVQTGLDRAAAAGSASSAATASTTATTKASEAQTSATNAATSATSAGSSAGTATTAASTATTQATAAAGSATTANTAATSAGNSATAAAGSATTATTQAAAAGNSATAAAGSATSAAGSATTATNKAGEASTSATAAAGSATNAATSASSASGSATTATSKATEASTSANTAQTAATSASGSATTATAKAGEAATSAANTATSQSAAAGSEANAALSATAAAGSATGAATSETNAATSASSASTSATMATTQAGIATTKAGEAATSATGAAGSATAASGSASAASGSAATAAGSATTATNAATTATTQAGYAATSATDAAASAAIAASSAAAATSGGIRFDSAQTLNPTEKGQARNNMGLATVAATGAYSDLSGTPTNISEFANDSGYATGGGTAAGTNTGDESATTIRAKLGITTLSGSNTGDQTIPATLPASDVSAWAKAGTKPTYTNTEVGAAAASHAHATSDVTGFAAAALAAAPAETVTTIKAALGITTLSGSNTGDQVLPTTLPASDVSAWAKAATKPSYTNSEVGAAAASHAHATSDITGFAAAALAAAPAETATTIRAKLGITTLSGSNTGDQTIPTTLPASDVYAWAKAATKPSYTAGEVGSDAAGTARPASDVYSWAKASTKPSYSYSEVGAQPAGSYPTGSGTSSGTNTGDQTTVSGSSGSTNALNSASTTVNVSSATAPTAGQVLTATSSTAATWQTPAAAAGSITATATGSLANGDKVVVNSDGTVSVVVGSSYSNGNGTGAVYASGQTGGTTAAYDSANNRVVVVYSNSSAYGYAVVGTVSGTTISLGTPVAWRSAGTYGMAAAFDSVSGKIVIAASANDTTGIAIVGTVSGTSISFGTAVTFNSAYTGAISIVETISSKVVICYQDANNSYYGTAIVGTVSGTAISFGAATVWVSSNCNPTSVCYDTGNSKVVVAYVDQGGSPFNAAVVGTISGTGISFGTPLNVTGSSGVGGYARTIACVYVASVGKIAIVWNDSGGTSPRAVVGTVSGTSISCGTYSAMAGNSVEDIRAVYHADYGKVVVTGHDTSNSSRAIAGAITVSGTTCSFSTRFTISPINAYVTALTYDTLTKQALFAWADQAATYPAYYGTVETVQIAYSSTNLTASNYIGISNAAYSNGATATIQTVGSTDDAQSGLTAGQPYYVQFVGTLSTTPGSPSVFAGTAISATKLIIKG